MLIEKTYTLKFLYDFLISDFFFLKKLILIYWQNIVLLRRYKLNAELNPRPPDVIRINRLLRHKYNSYIIKVTVISIIKPIVTPCLINLIGCVEIALTVFCLLIISTPIQWMSVQILLGKRLYYAHLYLYYLYAWTVCLVKCANYRNYRFIKKKMFFLVFNVPVVFIVYCIQIRK